MAFRRPVGRPLALAALGLASLMAAGPSLAATTFTTTSRIPVSLFAFVPCANEGAGEFVSLAGTVNEVLRLTIDDAGGLHLKGQDNPQGVAGVGLTSGATYQGTGVSQFTQDVRPAGFPVTFTAVNNFRIIGQGAVGNLLVHELFHVTVNANGNLTAFVADFSLVCQRAGSAQAGDRLRPAPNIHPTRGVRHRGGQVLVPARQRAGNWGGPRQAGPEKPQESGRHSRRPSRAAGGQP